VGSDAPKDTADALDVEGADRRSVEDMRSRLSLRMRLTSFFVRATMATMKSVRAGISFLIVLTGCGTSLGGSRAGLTTAPADPGCELSCGQSGECGRPLVGVACRARSAKDCKRSSGCELSARCSIQSGICVVGSDADCARSWLCTREGRCKFDQGQANCVAESDAACKATPMCKQDGHCTLDKELGLCLGASDADCKQSTGCTEQGRCRYQDHICVR
jgi:hypothetical protein